MFIDTIVDDSAKVWDLLIRVECMIGYIPERVGYGSEKLRLLSLHDCYIGFAGAAPQFNSIGPYIRLFCARYFEQRQNAFNSLNAELNPIC
jgi:hypothetical protein